MGKGHSSASEQCTLSTRHQNQKRYSGFSVILGVLDSRTYLNFALLEAFIIQISDLQCNIYID